MKLNFYLRGLGIGMVVTSILMGITNKPAKLSDEQIKMRAMELGMVKAEDMVLTDTMKPEVKPDAVEAPAMPEIEIGQEAVTEPDNFTISDNGAISEELTASNNEAMLGDLAVSANEAAIKDTVVSDNEIGEAPEGMLLQVGTKADEAEDGQAVRKQEEKSEDSSKKDKEAEKSEDSSSKKDKETEKSGDGSSSKNSESSSSEKKEVKPEEIPKTEKNSGADNEGLKVDTITINITSGMSSTAIAKACENAGLVKNAAKFDSFLCEKGYDRRLTVGKKVIPVGASEVEIAGILTVH